jgi:hypothetical protein
VKYPNTLQYFDKRWYLSVLDIRSFRAADCDTDHCLVVANVRHRLIVSKQTRYRYYVEKFDLMKLNEVGGKEQCCAEFSNRCAVLENLHTELDINRAMGNC